MDAAVMQAGRLRAMAPPAAALAMLIAAWWAGSRAGLIPFYLLPSPAALVEAFRQHPWIFVRHARITAGEALLGFAVGNLAAVASAVLIATIAPVRVCLYPLALASRGIPIVAVTPLLVILLGYGTAPIICVVAISAFFPTLLNMVRGLRAADAGQHELLHTLSAGRLQVLRLIELPASLPYLFAALKVGASAAFIGAIVGEWIGSDAGLGYLIVEAGSHFQLPLLWGAVLVAALMTLATVGAVGAVERLLLHARPQEDWDGP